MAKRPAKRLVKKTIRKKKTTSRPKSGGRFVSDISQRKGRNKYTIKFKRRHRNKRETDKLIKSIDYARITKAYPKTTYVHITFFAEYKGKKVARTYIAQITDGFTELEIMLFLLEFVADIFSGKLNYGIPLRNKWKNYIDNIEFTDFKRL